MATADALKAIAAASDTRRVGPIGRKMVVTFSPGDDWVGIEQLPASLARDAGLDVDVYSLARLTASENSSDGPSYRLAVCEVGLNELERRRRVNAPTRTLSPTGNLVERTSGGKFARTQGHYGQQRGRWASTYRDPSESDVVAAQAALSRKTDLAKGAVRFFSPKAQNGGIQAGRKLAKDAEDVIRLWGSDGYAWVGPVSGIDAYRLMLFRHQGRAANSGEIAAALAVNKRGLSGEPAPVATGPEPSEQQEIKSSVSEIAIVFAVGVLGSLIG